MGFFNFLFDVGCPGKAERYKLNSEIEHLERLFPYGYEFEYLGSTCVVVGHKETIPTYPSQTNVPKLVYEYRDADLIVRNGRFGYEQALILLNSPKSRNTPALQPLR